ncbi:hypothetical protein BC936DRAFT_149410 [Jimgerdemannia flammicorona]|uniref:G-protein coupled receptors family 1 profile domain-containing protein n=1 Tax=Jimgerdemannia flammicorona TaxID=994334 RepID=A0A433D0V7_9FUNG|nr:hypothetical protein BC936DRAFT_149410 [Jimgerdemannia flammicorona]
MLVPTPEVSHLHFVVILAFTVVYGVFFLTTTIMFFVYARRDQRLCKRSVWLTGIGGLANTLTSVVYMASFAYVRAWPCWLDFVVGYLGLVPVILTIVCRTIRLVLISWHQESLLKRHLDNSKVKQSWLVGPSQAIIERRLIIALVIILFVDMVFVIVTLLTDEYNGDPNVKSVAFKPAISYFCAPAIEFYPFYAFLGVSLFVFCPGLLYFLPKLQDAFGIRTALMCSSINPHGVRKFSLSPTSSTLSGMLFIWTGTTNTGPRSCGRWSGVWLST